MSDSGLIRILTVDDHALLRNGIAGLVTDEPDIELVAQASTGCDAIEQFRDSGIGPWRSGSSSELTGYIGESVSKA